MSRPQQQGGFDRCVFSVYCRGSISPSALLKGFNVHHFSVDAQGLVRCQPRPLEKECDLDQMQILRAKD